MPLYRPETPRRPVAMIAFALVGLVLCVLNAGGAGLLCLTAGCQIYAGYSLFGLSFYVYGAAWFGAVLLLTPLSGRRSAPRRLLFWTVLAGLLADTLFLAWQILFWPCLSCLFVALLLGLTAWSCRSAFTGFRRGTLQAAFALWLVAFILVGVAAGKEVLLPPWPIYGPASAEVRVFFSPTCPACERVVTNLLDHPEAAARTAFFPIAKNAEDGRRLARLLKEGRPDRDRLRTLFTGETGTGPEPDLALRFRLAKNKMTLAKMGASTIPLILSPVMLEAAPPAATAAPSAAPSPAPGWPFDLGCGAFAVPEGEVCQ